jgi:hypothetical protein
MNKIKNKMIVMKLNKINKKNNIMIKDKVIVMRLNKIKVKN